MTVKTRDRLRAVLCLEPPYGARFSQRTVFPPVGRFVLHEGTRCNQPYCVVSIGENQRISSTALEWQTPAIRVIGLVSRHDTHVDTQYLFFFVTRDMTWLK